MENIEHSKNLRIPQKLLLIFLVPSLFLTVSALYKVITMLPYTAHAPVQLCAYTYVHKTAGP